MIKRAVLWHAQSVASSNPHQCLWIHDWQVCRLKRLRCQAVKRSHTRGESEESIACW